MDRCRIGLDSPIHIGQFRELTCLHIGVLLLEGRKGPNDTIEFERTNDLCNTRKHLFAKETVINPFP